MSKRRMSAHDRAFYGGVCVALQSVALFDDSVLWREIVGAVGPKDFLRYVTEIEPEEAALVKLKRYREEINRLLGSPGRE